MISRPGFGWGERQGGFTLLEVLVAVTVFAIGALMIVPTMLTWTEANAVSMQRGEVIRMLESQRAALTQMGEGQPPWTTGNATADNYSAARSTLMNLNPGSLNDLDGVAGFNAPSNPDLGVNTSALYAVVSITDKGGNVLSRVLRLRLEWDGPAGRPWAQEAILQR